MNDQMLHITLLGGQARALALDATRAVGEAERIHMTSPLATAALGRALMGTAMLGALIKQEDASVTVTIDGGGPIGRLVCVCDGGANIRGMVDNPDLNLPLNARGKLDVGGAVGSDGRISVVKDLRLKAPYVGQTRLISGEIAEDFAGYYLQSEQSPTLQALGVLVDRDGVKAAGGVLVQPLPDCSEEALRALEALAPTFSDLSVQLLDAGIEELCGRWFEGTDMQIIDVTPVRYRCGCSRARMEKTLIALGSVELQSIIDDEREGAELVCHFCGRRESFTQEELKQLLLAARGSGCSVDTNAEGV